MMRFRASLFENLEPVELDADLEKSPRCEAKLLEGILRLGQFELPDEFDLGNAIVGIHRDYLHVELAT